MSGNRYLFDTNTIVSFLKGNDRLDSLVKNSEWIGISIISYIEFLAFPELTDEDKSLFNEFANRIEVIGIMKENIELLDKITEIRRSYMIKLPDAVIVSTALVHNAKLVSADKKLKSIKEIEVSDFM